MSQNTKRTLLTEAPSGAYPSEEAFQKNEKTLITDALSETKDKRQEALEKAKNAVKDAFGEKVGQLVQEKLIEPPERTEVTEEEIQQLVKEIDAEVSENDPVVQEYKQRLNEARDSDLPVSDKETMYRDIHKKFWDYVKSKPEREAKPESDTDRAIKKFLTNKPSIFDPVQWFSYEGSAIVCALISVEDDGFAVISLNKLPEEDRNLINTFLLKKTGKQYDSKAFIVKFNDRKDFLFKTEFEDSRTDFQFVIGNRVASIPPNESSRFGNVDIKVERRGKDVIIGDRIVVEKSKLQNLLQTGEPASNGGGYRDREKEKKQKVAGRNAYEIRADILEMALEWVKEKGIDRADETDVIEVAEAFYKFVEHK